MTTVAIDEYTRYLLGELNNGNENLGETVTRLCEEEAKRVGISIPQHIKKLKPTEKAFS